jgi:hypothetical protein
MHSAIIYAVFAENPRHDERQRGAVFLGHIAKLDGNKSVAQLGEYVWQVNFRESPGALALIVAACEQLAIPYRILPLDAEPQWIRHDPSPQSVEV